MICFVLLSVFQYKIVNLYIIENLDISCLWFTYLIVLYHIWFGSTLSLYLSSYNLSNFNDTYVLFSYIAKLNIDYVVTMYVYVCACLHRCIINMYINSGMWKIVHSFKYVVLKCVFHLSD